MRYQTFNLLWRAVAEYDSYDMYVAERGWQEWMDEYEDADKISYILQKIYETAREINPVKAIITISNITQAAFAANYGASQRSVECWCAGQKLPTEGKAILLAFAVMSDVGII